MEVLFALAQLGSSVKEHLIQATKSSYYQVRSKALWMLVEHLSDDDLFGMQHILQDRSQDTIFVYLYSLMHRDRDRAVELLLSQSHLTSKASKACAFLLVDPRVEFPAGSFQRIFQRILTTAMERNGFGLSYEILAYLKGVPERQIAVKQVLVNLMETSEHSSVRRILPRLIRYFYSRDEEMLGLMNQWVVDDNDVWVRRGILETLLDLHTTYESVERKLLRENSYQYRDPRKPINATWVKKCSDELNESEAKIWERFETLAKVLPLKLER